MSGRRTGNRIRGPHSALTDFLAANNISAVQIAEDYNRRQAEATRQAVEQANAEALSNAAQVDEDEELAQAIAAEEVVQNARKRKRDTKDAVDKIKSAKKKKQAKKPDSDDDFDDDFHLYRKSKPVPGQFEHCELCEKRFTVTPYSKEGPSGGLLCTPCGKQLAKDAKKEDAANRKKPAGRKRRQAESNRLDGKIAATKSLKQLCIEKVVQYHDDVEELGEMPAQLLDRVSAIFSKKRVMNSKTVKLFIQPGRENITIYDAAYLEVDDYIQAFATTPSISSLSLRNAGQFKDSVVDYMLDKCDRIRHLHLYAANLVTNDAWCRIFEKYGRQLETVKLSWLDATFDDEIVATMVKHCPNIRRLKLKLLRRIGEASVASISKLKNLEHLTLQISQKVSSEALVRLVTRVGPKLQTLSLEHFLDLDDSVLAAIHDTCGVLKKLRVSENDTTTNAGYAALFKGWSNPPLTFVDVNTTRDVDNNHPEGPKQTIGLGDQGFEALMQHSGFALGHLDVSSCRHVSLSTFTKVFDGKAIYPDLQTINMSFCSRIDTEVVAGVFKSCPSIKKVIAFGCFDVLDVIVPRGVVLIGVPRAQDAIEQIGAGLDVDEALSRMIEAAA